VMPVARCGSAFALQFGTPVRIRVFRRQLGVNLEEASAKGEVDLRPGRNLRTSVGPQRDERRDSREGYCGERGNGCHQIGVNIHGAPLYG
jgi:hypothetical protein